MEINFIFKLAILIISVIAHEVAHGAAALAFGDQTAKNHGRLTMNPLKHIDMFGSIILPLILYLTGAGFLLGWAKPVPYNPYNLRNRRLGEFCVSVAGIATNFIIALFFSFILKFGLFLNLSVPTVNIIAYVVFLNVALAVFNLIPVPPLDGSKILFTLVPYRFERYILALEKGGIFLLFFIVLFFGEYISKAVLAVINLML